MVLSCSLAYFMKNADGGLIYDRRFFFSLSCDTSLLQETRRYGNQHTRIYMETKRHKTST